MNIIFRVDASTRIGSGHVMRCMTLAAALGKKGGLCRFVCREHAGNLIEQIRENGYTVFALPSTEATIDRNNRAKPLRGRGEYASWLGTDSTEDARQMLEALNGLAVDWVVVDHYAIDVEWERHVRGHCRRLMVIDDLADRAHECDLLLDQNLGRRREDYRRLTPEHCRLLIGSKYALLRPEFARLRKYSLERRKQSGLKRLVISMGGMDADNVTGKVLDILKESPLSADLHISVVMGSRAPWLEDIQALAALYPGNCDVLVNVLDMAQLMADSDLAIGAAGSTSWERCCLGLPSLVMALAANQRPAVAALEREGAAISLSLDEINFHRVDSCLSQLIIEPNLMAEMSSRAAMINDGDGTARVCQAFVEINLGDIERRI